MSSAMREVTTADPSRPLNPGAAPVNGTDEAIQRVASETSPLIFDADLEGRVSESSCLSTGKKMLGALSIIGVMAIGITGLGILTLNGFMFGGMIAFVLAVAVALVISLSVGE